MVVLIVDAVAGSSTIAEAISETRPECAVPALFTKMSTANSQAGQTFMRICNHMNNPETTEDAIGSILI